MQQNYFVEFVVMLCSLCRVYQNIFVVRLFSSFWCYILMQELISMFCSFK